MLGNMKIDVPPNHMPIRKKIVWFKVCYTEKMNKNSGHSVIRDWLEDRAW